MSREGATIWARKTLESDVFFWKPAEWFKIWFFIISYVNHKDNNLFQRGENFMSYEMISKKTNTTTNQVHGFIRWAKKSKMLTTRKSTRGMVIKVLNYAKYQDLSSYSKSTHESKSNPDRIHTINKNDNNEKKEEGSGYSKRVQYVADCLGEDFKITPRVIKAIDVDYADYLIKNTIDKMAAKYIDELQKTPTTMSLINWLINAEKFGELERRNK